MKTRAALALAVALATSAGAQDPPLLQNGDFQAVDGNGILGGWVLPPYPPDFDATGPVVFPAGSDNVALRLGDDPTGAGFALPQVLASQPLNLAFDPSSPPLRITVEASVARLGTDPPPADALIFQLSRLTLDGPSTTDFPVPTVPAGPGPPVRFNVTVQALVGLGPDLAPPELNILKSAPGTFIVDDLRVTVEPDFLQVFPERARASGDTEVFLESPFIGLGSQVFFNGIPAPVLDEQPGFLVVLAPPNPAGPAAIEVVNPGGSQNVRFGGFNYLEPVRVDRITPTPVVAGVQTAVVVEGSGFTTDTLFETGDGTPLVPDFFAGHDRVRLVLPPQPPGPFEVVVFPPLEFGADFRTAGQASDRQPQISSVEPDFSPLAGGGLLTVRGANFTPDTRIALGDTDAGGVAFLSAEELQVTIPPGPALRAVDVTTTDAVTGLATRIPNAFTYLAPLPGDTNGDFVLDLRDVVNSLIITTGGTPDDAVDTAADADGDGKLGTAEGITAFRGFDIVDFEGLAIAPDARIIVAEPSVPLGQPVTVEVNALNALYLPARIEWGDGHSTDIISDGTYTHHHVFPGHYRIRLRSDNGLTEPANAEVFRLAPLHVDTRLRFVATPPGGGAPQTGSLVNAPPDSTLGIEIEIDASAPRGGTIGGEIIVRDVELPDPVVVRRIDIELPPAVPVQTEIIQIQLESIPPIDVGQSYSAVFVADPGLSAPGAGRSLEASVFTPASELEEDCKEIEAQWRAAVAAKAAKKQECEDREDQLDDCEDARDATQANKDAQQAERDARQAERDAKQQEFNDLFDYIDNFLGGSADLHQYSPDGIGVPADTQFSGARRRGSSSGIGISFISYESMQSRVDLYKTVNGHSIGRDLNRLRDMIREMDELDAELEDLDNTIQDLCDDLDALDADIAAKQQALADCRQECDDLEQDIQDLEDAHRDCLEELERQREAEDEAAGDIEDAEQDGSNAEDELDDTRGSADDADEVIGGRAGSPGQTQGDRDEVQTGRDCADTAENLIAQGDAKLQEARDALALGDTDTAKAKAAEARALYAQAEEKLDDAQSHIDRGESSARRRKPRQCTDGALEVGVVREFKVWDTICDIGFSPQGTSLQEWTRQKENADSILEGIQRFLDLLDIFGDHSPISGPITPDAGEAAEAIVNAHLKLFEQRFPFDVWADVKGHTEWRRTDRLCVHGCWENQHHGGSRGDHCTDQRKIGTIWGGDTESRKEQLDKIIDRFFADQTQQQNRQ